MKSELDQYLEMTFAHGYRNATGSGTERVNAAYQFLADDIKRYVQSILVQDGLDRQLLAAALNELTPTQWHTLAANLFNQKGETD